MTHERQHCLPSSVSNKTLTTYLVLPLGFMDQHEYLARPRRAGAEEDEKGDQELRRVYASKTAIDYACTN